ncbi:MAG: FAD-dependent oxidoreductase [Patescibacteria group bacterium]
MKYTARLLKRETIAAGTMTFYFEKPSGFNFVAGQYVDLTLINPPETDTEGNRRSFSIASAPCEDTLMIATRMRDTALKRVLKSMPIGTEVQLDGPMGSFTLHHDAGKPAIFLMGGIGVTPARSMIVQAAHENLPHELWLFYSNKRPEDAAFLNELVALQKENPRYHCITTMTDPSSSQQNWTGETGLINNAMIDKYLKAKSYKLKAIFYISGPPAMVAAMRNALSEMKTNPDNIRTEEFSGY